MIPRQTQRANNQKHEILRLQGTISDIEDANQQLIMDLQAFESQTDRMTMMMIIDYSLIYCISCV